tara:strand:+ start:2496 stop:3308 length:813 start_codon:yes stop_codon:yes gene_type:complete
MMIDIFNSKNNEDEKVVKNNTQEELKIEPSPTFIPTPEATITPTPTPIPTSTPEPPSIGGKAMAYLSSLYNIKPINLKLFKYERKQWPSSAMGCPEPGKYYAQAETSGWALHFIERNNKEYLVHTDENGTNIIECKKNLPENTINIVKILDLSKTEEITLKRLKEGKYFELETLKDENKISPIIQFLDIDVIGSKNTREECEFLMELEFITKNSTQKIKFICTDGSNFMKISHKNLQEEIFGIPIQLVNHLGKYASQVPFPGIPEKPNSN